MLTDKVCRSYSYPRASNVTPALKTTGVVPLTLPCQYCEFQSWSVRQPAHALFRIHIPQHNRTCTPPFISQSPQNHTQCTKKQNLSGSEPAFPTQFIYKKNFVNLIRDS